MSRVVHVGVKVVSSTDFGEVLEVTVDACQPERVRLLRRIGELAEDARTKAHAFKTGGYIPDTGGGELSSLFEAIRQGLRVGTLDGCELHFALDSAAPDLLHLPLEYSVDPDSGWFVRSEIDIVRSMGPASDLPVFPDRRPRLLILQCDVGSTWAEKEVAGIQGAVPRSRLVQWTSDHTVDNATKLLEGALIDYRPEILHVIAHGAEAGVAYGRQGGVVPYQTLAAVIARSGWSGIGLIVLTVCDSTAPTVSSNDSALVRGLGGASDTRSGGPHPRVAEAPDVAAAQLMAVPGVQAVIGAQAELDERGAFAFSRLFYTELYSGDSRRLPEAVRKSIRPSAYVTQHQIGVVTIHSKTRDLSLPWAKATAPVADTTQRHVAVPCATLSVPGPWVPFEGPTGPIIAWGERRSVRFRAVAGGRSAPGGLETPFDVQALCASPNGEGIAIGGQGKVIVLSMPRDQKGRPEKVAAFDVPEDVLPVALRIDRNSRALLLSGSDAAVAVDYRTRGRGEQTPVFDFSPLAVAAWNNAFLALDQQGRLFGERPSALSRTDVSWTAVDAAISDHTGGIAAAGHSTSSGGRLIVVRIRDAQQAALELTAPPARVAVARGSDRSKPSHVFVELDGRIEVYRFSDLDWVASS